MDQLSEQDLALLIAQLQGRPSVRGVIDRSGGLLRQMPNPDFYPNGQPQAAPPAAPGAAANAADMGPSVPEQAPESVLPKSRGAAPQQSEARAMLQRALQMYGSTPDMTALNQYAAQRESGADSSMLNAYAAQFAGKGFEPFQAQYLRRAASLQAPEQIGDYGMTAGGKFIADPYRKRDVEAKATLDVGGKLLDNEEAAARDEAADRRWGLRYGNNGGLTPGERQINGRMLDDYRKQSDAARVALSSVPDMNDALNNMNDGVFGPLVQKVKEVAASVGMQGARNSAAAGQLADAISKQFGIAKLQDIGGNDTDKELLVSISTTFNGTNLREVNQKLLQKFEEIARRKIDRYNQAVVWTNENDSIIRVNGDGQTFDSWFYNNYAPETNKSGGAGTREIVVDW